MALHIHAPVVFANLDQAQLDAFNTTGLPVGVEVYNTTLGRNVKWDGNSWNIISQFDEVNSLVKSSLSGFMYGAAPIEAIVFAQIFDVDTTFPQNVPFTMCRALTAPTEPTTVDILRVDKSSGTQTPIGTITFSSTANQTASVAFPNQVVMSIDDIMVIKTRADTNDMANLFINIVGYSTLPTY